MHTFATVIITIAITLLVLIIALSMFDHRMQKNREQRMQQIRHDREQQRLRREQERVDQWFDDLNKRAQEGKHASDE